MWPLPVLFPLSRLRPLLSPPHRPPPPRVCLSLSLWIWICKLLHLVQIVTQLSPSVTPEVMVNLYVTFTLKRSEEDSWQVTFTHRVGQKVEQHVADFVISKEELLTIRRLPPQSTYGFLKSSADPGGFVQVNVLPFLQALDAIATGAP